jgi:TfoX/Sxy family transcriptional regulator of competence genes
VTSRRDALVERIRIALAEETTVREVAMFGGRSFLVRDAMVVSAFRDGDLLVRADPKRHRELTALPGAGPAEMGAGRPMGRSWIRVASDAITSDDDLSFWIRLGLEHNSATRG